MRAMIDVDMDNAAFEETDGGTGELARILRVLADDLDKRLYTVTDGEGMVERYEYRRSWDAWGVRTSSLRQALRDVASMRRLGGEWRGPWRVVRLSDGRVMRTWGGEP